jgi:hypothetical protein
MPGAGFPIAIALLLAASAAQGAAVSLQLAADGELPMQFETNRGQADAAVRFTGQGTGYSVQLSAREAVLLLEPEADAAAPAASVALRLRLVGSRLSPAVTGVEELPGANGPAFGKVRYSEVYPGIDLLYYGNQQQLEYDFIVAPGANPALIALEFSGADRLEIDASGDLLLDTPAGTVRQHRPVAWQQSAGVRREVAARYVRRGPTTVGLQLGEYDRGLTLLIDPVLAAPR